MKIHRQPANPATPSIFWIAKASKPEKAPAMEAAEKKTARRVCTSKRAYQQVRRYVAAGKNPDSVKPRRVRVMINPL